MRIALIGINSNLIHSFEQEKMVSYLKKRFYEIGEDVSLISYFNNSYEFLKNVFQNKYDLVFCFGTEQSIFNYNIKENLCKIFSDKLETNSSCENCLRAYCKTNDIPFASTEEMEIKVPIKAIPLCDKDFSNNGFMYKYGETYAIFLPSNIDFLTKNYNNYILPLITDLTKVKCENLTIRCYGILEKDIRKLISDELNNNTVSIQIFNDRLDNTIYIRYNEDSSKEARDILSSICSKLNKFIYATEDTDLYKTANYLLNLHKKHLVIAETITLGNVTKKMSLIDRGVILDSYLFNNFESIGRMLSIDKGVFEKYGKYSVNTVYELDNTLLENSNADIAIFVYGDPNEDICYIAIGDLDGIHVYKNKINCKNDELIDNISDTTLFYLIKKLRQNDLQFR